MVASSLSSFIGHRFLEAPLAAQLMSSACSARAHNHQPPAARPTIRCSGGTVSPARLPQEMEAFDSTYTPPTGPSSMNFATTAVNALFSFKPFFQFAAGQARKMIKDRGDSLGIPWDATLEEMKKHDWEAEYRAAENPSVTYPEYFIVPFHAYERGNLSWAPALEMELASRSVHAPVFDPEHATLDPNGDRRLRRSYHDTMKTMLKKDPKRIVDLGCGAGLSTLALHDAFPSAHITGLDLSPYMVAVSKYHLQEKNKKEGTRLPINYIHAIAEETGLPSSSVDLVSICLVCHELPRTATKKIIEEAHRILRPGGVFAVMEMNPQSPFLHKMVDNVFAFTAFKATEPYFDDYRTFPIEEAIAERGFYPPEQKENSPRHRTIVAHKK